jgi:hypothetical protein
MQKDPEIVKVKGTLEIQRRRGVIYFHVSNPRDVLKYNAVTLLRVCRLEPILKVDGLIDVAAR